MRPIDRQKIYEGGFTLIEMAIIIIIVGLIVGTVVPLMVSNIKQQKLLRIRNEVRELRDEIVGFAINSSSSSNQRRLPNLSEFQTIGHSVDTFNNPMFYRFAQGLTNPGSICSVSSTNLSVAIPSSGLLINNVAFIVGSNGPNYLQQTNLSADPVVIYHPGTQVNGRGYDDVVEFVTLNYLKGKCGCP